MWWTVITLAGVAAWFEWTYRRNRKSPSDENAPSKTPDAAKDKAKDEELEKTQK